MSVRHVPIRFNTSVLIWLGAICLSAAGQESSPVSVEPSELLKRADLIGREILVDDHLRYFQFHPGEGFDEIQLKRTPVIFRIPRPLRPQSAPKNPVVQVRAFLRREGEQLFGDVTSFQLQPTDLERLDKAVARLAANDLSSRQAWASWGLERSKAFGDKALRDRSLALQGEALRLEGDSVKNLGSPDTWMKLAEQARREGIPEPEPSTLAHKAFHSRVLGLSSLETADELISAVEKFFPKSKDRLASDALPGNLKADYHLEPGKAYRMSTPEVRSILDRRLWLDATEKRMRLAAKLDPLKAIDLSLKAEVQLPERPQISKEFAEIGIEAAIRGVANLRLAEVRETARVIRDTFHQPDRAETLLRDWLKVQKSKVSATDSDGLLTLASRYEELVNDRNTAVEFLNQAWKADPGAKEVALAFRTRGYRRVGEEWVHDGPVGGTQPGDNPEQPDPKEASPKPGKSSLKGLTTDEVRRKLGNRPDQVVYIATRGRLVEQWIYRLPRHNRYVNFIRTPNELKSRVISEYSLQRTANLGRPGSPPGASPSK